MLFTFEILMTFQFFFNIFRSLQVKLDKPISEPESPRTLNDFNYGSGDTAANLANNIRALKQVRFVEEY